MKSKLQNLKERICSYNIEDLNEDKCSPEIISGWILDLIEILEENK